MLVTTNTASGNGFSGILIGSSSIVTHNTANANGDDGIAVGQAGLVSHNTANDNGDNGVVGRVPVHRDQQPGVRQRERRLRFYRPRLLRQGQHLAGPRRDRVP